MNIMQGGFSVQSGARKPFGGFLWPETIGRRQQNTQHPGGTKRLQPERWGCRRDYRLEPTSQGPCQGGYLKADRTYLGPMILVAENKKLKMSDVLGHPWGLCPGHCRAESGYKSVIITAGYDVMVLFWGCPKIPFHRSPKSGEEPDKIPDITPEPYTGGSGFDSLIGFSLYRGVIPSCIRLGPGEMRHSKRGRGTKHTGCFPRTWALMGRSPESLETTGKKPATCTCLLPTQLR
ncbi:hypothetical protein GWK47_013373 [Chionoecetes opilio]|uniref:Uncharacterized protein n=1 Tax=Chionoecetes opilio TaxID=41210 RepID=A0A8J4XXZ3_CHIOP|nr:hypothetical protein GWK47_013373 [Chionoecetes opilio]